jgi:hypothetical protein
MYANNSDGLGWDGGRCYFEGHGEFFLADDLGHDVWYGNKNEEIPHQIKCDQGPDPLEQYGYFTVSYEGFGVEFQSFVNDTDFIWPPAVDAMSSNTDWCARKCALTDGCRYFSYDEEEGYCRFHEEKGGCHPQPTSHRRRYGVSSTYLIPKEFQTELSVDHIVAALEEGTDYFFSHAGFCASGWLTGMINHRSSLEACARWCRDVPVCGYFTWSASKEYCALYDVQDECPSSTSDITTTDFVSFGIIRPAEGDGEEGPDHYSDFQLLHMGFCDQGSDFLGYDYDRQFAYVFNCAEYCHDTEGCAHFSFSRRNFHCRLFGSTCIRPTSPYGQWPNGNYHGEATQYGLDNNLQYGESNMQNGFTWFWEANDWYPWALPNTTDYMYSSYHVGSSYRRDPGPYTPASFGEFIGCGDRASITLESGINMQCREFFPGWDCASEESDLTNYSYGNCSGSCGVCTTYCFNIELGATNTHGYNCDLYDEMPVLCDIAEDYDDDDFTASFHCCACGGGSRNTCLPDDFVVAPFTDGSHRDAYVVSLNPQTDEIIVEFPDITGADPHTVPRDQVSKYNNRPCSHHSHQMYLEGWVYGR